MKNNWRRNNNYEPAVKGIAVEVRNGDVNGAIRRFKRKVQDAGIIQEIRERQHYVKSSEQRKKAKAAGRARWLKKVSKMELEHGPIMSRKKK